MNSLDENIKDVVEKHIEKNGFFLIDLVLRGTEKNKIIEAYIDGEKNVSTDDCAILCREIDENLLTLLAKHPNYRLEVSSPGIDRPLKFLKQYPKHIGRKFELFYHGKEQDQKLNGKLSAIEGDNLTFISNNKEVIINFNNIVKANVMVSFS